MDFSFSVSGPPKVDLKDSYDVVIIGAGPAGLTAAIYASRAQLATLVVNKGAAGGLAASTEWIENYPGFPEGVSGAELGRAMQAQAQRFGAEIFNGEPETLNLTADPRIIRMAGKDITTRAVIIATGGGACMYPRTDNPPGATGDGIVMAYEAGAELVVKTIGE